MKLKVNFLTIRKNGELVDAIPIVNSYTVVQVYINKEVMTYDDFKSYGIFGQELSLNYYLGESEAHDFVGTYGSISIKIEEKELELS